MSTKRNKIASWVLITVLALMMLLSGGMKLAGSPELLANFQGWGYAVWFFYLIGALEVLGAIGLFIPKLRTLAALGLLGLMIGALGTHLIHGEYDQSAGSIIALALSGSVVFLRKQLFA